MPRTMTVTLLNDGGKYVAVDLKHIAKGESCRMDEGATIARVGQGEPGHGAGSLRGRSDQFGRVPVHDYIRCP
jgi:hypothetical protein